MKKPLTKCQQCQHALGSCRELLSKEMAKGAEPHWLVKDFNVLYRVAQRLLDTLPIEHAGETRAVAAADLRRQLERLKPAFTDTEEVRELMRSRQG